MYTHRCFFDSILKHVSCTIVALGFFAAHAIAQQTEKLPVTETKTVSIQTVKDYLKKLSTDPNFQYAQIGFSLKSIASGNTLLDVNGGKSLSVASNTKLITTSTALAILGEDFTFKTSIEYTGKIDASGTLNGDIIIHGGGDPTLGSDRYKGFPEMDELLKLWVEKIKALKIKKITGSIIADQEIFEENNIPDSWMWMDIGNYYGAGVYGININENLYRLYFKKNTQIGSAAEVLKTDPIIPDLQFNNFVTVDAKGSGDNCYIYGQPYCNDKFLKGTIPSGDINFFVKGAIPDPSFLTAHYLKGIMVAAGISVAGAAITSRQMSIQSKALPTERKLIYTHNSPMLKDIILLTNQLSINIYAEAILKMIGYKSTGKGTTIDGISAVETYWKSKGLSMPGFFMADGCGLSPMSTFTANQMTDILKITSTAKYYNAFKASLPIAGVSGTLSGFCKGTAAENNLCAKSGNMMRVSSYAGYVKNAAGELLCFTLSFNNFGADNYVIKKKVEKVMSLLAEMK